MNSIPTPDEMDAILEAAEDEMDWRDDPMWHRDLRTAVGLGGALLLFGLLLVWWMAA